MNKRNSKLGWAMKFPVLKKENTPPQKALSMEEYSDFVEFCLKNTNPENARAQKAREERITALFTLWHKGIKQES